MVFRAEVSIDASYEDELTEILFAYQAVSISSEAERGLVKLTAIFEDIDHVEDFLKTNGFSISEMTDDEWKYKWLEGYAGGELTENIYVVPSEKEVAVPADYTYCIQLDPRDAFGDGRHPTTRQCAVFLEEYLKDRGDVSGLSILDAGTGTGLLAIVGGLNGVRKIDAIDIEKESVDRTLVNIKLNKMEWINVMEADAGTFQPGICYDVVCANLLTDVIVKTIDNLKQLMSENGIMIVSGIGIQWKDEVGKLFKEKQLSIVGFTVVDDWCCFKLMHQENKKTATC